MSELWNSYKAPIIAIGVLIALALSGMNVVSETEQAVIVRAGQPVKTVNRFNPNQEFGDTGAGIYWHVPLYEQVVWIDKRIMNVDMDPQQVLSTDQLRLNVDAYARYRIIDPIKMVQTTGSVEQLESQLSPILSSVVRQELGRRSFSSLLNAERGSTMDNIRKLLDAQARKYGAQVIDVRIKRADLPDGTPLESAFSRMRSARQEEAATIRAQGQRDAQIIRADADAEAARIYASAYGKDPDFYDFYRAMESYRTTFASQESESSIILSPDNEYLKQFRGR